MYVGCSVCNWGVIKVGHFLIKFILAVQLHIVYYIKNKLCLVVSHKLHI